jgi:hypothetical protein
LQSSNLFFFFLFFFYDAPFLAFSLSFITTITTTTSPAELPSPKATPTNQEEEAKNYPYLIVIGRPMTTGEVVEAAAVPRVVSILSALLQRVAERNDAAAAAEEGRRRPVSAFQGLTKPAISIGGYLERIFRFASCSPSCYVVAYIYLDRFLRRRPALAVDSFNVHRLLITSVLTAVKFVDDMYVLSLCIFHVLRR